MEQMNYASPLCVRSRRTYGTQCMLEYFVALLALCITAAGFALNVFAVPAPGSSRCSTRCCTPSGRRDRARTWSTCPSITFPQIISFTPPPSKNSIGGVCGFLASLLGGWLLERIQQNGSALFGLRVYGQQALSLLSFILLCVAALFTRAVIVPQKVMKQ